MMTLTIQNPFYLRLGDLEAIHQRTGIRLKVSLDPSKVVIVDEDHVAILCLLCGLCQNERHSIMPELDFDFRYSLS